MRHIYTVLPTEDETLEMTEFMKTFFFKFRSLPLTTCFLSKSLSGSIKGNRLKPIQIAVNYNF